MRYVQCSLVILLYLNLNCLVCRARSSMTENRDEALLPETDSLLQSKRGHSLPRNDDVVDHVEPTLNTNNCVKARGDMRGRRDSGTGQKRDVKDNECPRAARRGEFRCMVVIHTPDLAFCWSASTAAKILLKRISIHNTHTGRESCVTEITDSGLSRWHPNALII